MQESNLTSRLRSVSSPRIVWKSIFAEMLQWVQILHIWIYMDIWIYPNSSVNTTNVYCPVHGWGSTGQIILAVGKGVEPLALSLGVIKGCLCWIISSAVYYHTKWILGTSPECKNECLNVTWPSGRLVCLSFWILCSWWWLPNPRGPGVLKLHRLWVQVNQEPSSVKVLALN